MSTKQKDIQCCPKCGTEIATRSSMDEYLKVRDGIDKSVPSNRFELIVETLSKIKKMADKESAYELGEGVGSIIALLDIAYPSFEKYRGEKI